MLAEFWQQRPRKDIDRFLNCARITGHTEVLVDYAAEFVPTTIDDPESKNHGDPVVLKISPGYVAVFTTENKDCTDLYELYESITKPDVESILDDL